MNKMGFLMISLFVFISTTYAELDEISSCVEGYYWREYTGEIPKDALPGGLDANGAAIYIGQVMHGTTLLPGQIRESEKSVIYHDRHHTQVISNKYIKILCGYNSEDFEWIKTDNSHVKDVLKDNHLILGGYYDNPEDTVYIGRLSAKNQILVGMIFICNSEEYGRRLRFGLHIVGDGKSTTYTSYEILAYNPKFRNVKIPEKVIIDDARNITVERKDKCAHGIININIH